MQDRYNIVRAGGMRGIRRLMRALDIDPHPALNQCGLTAEMFADPDKYIAYRNVLKAIEYPYARFGIRDFGLRLAGQQDIDVLGALSLAIKSAATIRDAFIIAAKFVHFHTPAVQINITADTQAGVERIEFHFLLENLPSLPQSTEHIVAHLVGVVHLLSAGSVSPKAICFRHKSVDHHKNYKRHLGQVPTFEAEFDGIIMDAMECRRPVSQSNPMLLDMAKRYIMDITPMPDAPLDDQIRNVLKHLMRHGPASLKDTARTLHTHPRTLQRKLNMIGVKFDDIRDDVRKELFLEYINQPRLPLSHIAQLIGYADQSVMTRSCQRWFGKTPKKMRP